MTKQVKQFIPLIQSNNEAYNQLSIVEQVAFSAIYNRLSSSERNEGFFDKKLGKHFVIYSNEELAKLTKTSHRTITRAIKHMCELGLLSIKRTFNGVHKLFPVLPDEMARNVDITPCAKLAHTHTPIWHTNHINNNHNKNTNNTINTASEPERVQIANIDLNKLNIKAYSSMLTTKLNMPETAVKTLEAFSFGNIDVMKEYTTLILKAKKCVFNTANSQKYQYAKQSTQFETNQYIAEGLSETITRVLVSAKNKAKNKNWFNKFVMKSFIAFFEECAEKFNPNNLISM